MEKPFDLKALGERLKGKGLVVAEDLLETLAGEMFGWVEESLVIHPNPYVKFAAPIVANIKPLAMGALDKIDGKIGS